MRFRWDWLEPVMRAPYVPTLGPVPPAAVSAELFDAVLNVANTGRFLPYDKDRRWGDSKDERVLLDSIEHIPDRTIIPTLSTRGGGLVKLHHYALTAPDLAEMTALGNELSRTHGAKAGHRVIWFSDEPTQARTRVMIKTFTEEDGRPVEGTRVLKYCPVADTFGAFADEIGPEGFQFLYQRMKAGHQDGPVLVAVEDDRIVGAVGPLSLMTGPDGKVTQAPAYFAVHPRYRGRGHGRHLWRASMIWGWHAGAEVKILQASMGSAAETLYASEGLESVGYVCQAG